MFYNEKKLQERLHLMRGFMEVKQERQKIYYDRGKYGPEYRRKMLVSSSTVKKGEKRKFIISIGDHTKLLKS